MKRLFPILILFLLISGNINSQVSYRAVYHPFYNGIQMVEIYFELSFSFMRSIIDYPILNCCEPPPMPHPDPTAYLFRDTTGKIINTYNLLRKNLKEFELAPTEKLDQTGLKPHEHSYYTVINPGKVNVNKLSSIKWANSDLSDTKYGIIDSMGKLTVPYSYNEIMPANKKNLFFAKKGRKYGVIDGNGKILLPFVYDEMTSEDYSNGILIARKGNKYSYISHEGKLISKREYDSGELFWSRRALVRLGNKYSYIDSTGTVICPMIYDAGYSFYYTVARVAIAGKLGLIDNTGTIVVPLQYDSFEFNYPKDETDERFELPAGYIARKGSETFYFDLAGKPVK